MPNWETNLPCHPLTRELIAKALAGLSGCPRGLPVRRLSNIAARAGMQVERDGSKAFPRTHLILEGHRQTILGRWVGIDCFVTLSDGLDEAGIEFSLNGVQRLLPAVKQDDPEAEPTPAVYPPDPIHQALVDRLKIEGILPGNDSLKLGERVIVPPVFGFLVPRGENRRNGANLLSALIVPETAYVKELRRFGLRLE